GWAGGGCAGWGPRAPAVRRTPGEVAGRGAGEAAARLQEALDAARGALRGGAREVHIVSLESFEEMPVLRTTQGHEEFEEAKREGVKFLPRRGPKRFLGDVKLAAVELRRVRSVFDDAARFAPQYDHP